MSALIVLVRLPPELEAFRLAHVPTARQGMPAHVTLLYPFMEPADVDEAGRQTLLTLAARTPAFEFRLPSVARWPTTAYLEVEPAWPFEALVANLVGAFPGFLPYGGEYPFVPHVSLAEDDPNVPLEGTEGALAEVHRATFRADAVVLVARERGQWLPAETFPLGTG